MNHPIHVHGLWMDLDNGTGADRPRKHTIIVPPGRTVAFNITMSEVGRWPFHCHLLFHMMTGMFREFVVHPRGEPLPAAGSKPAMPAVHADGGYEPCASLARLWRWRSQPPPPRWTIRRPIGGSMAWSSAARLRSRLTRPGRPRAGSAGDIDKIRLESSGVLRDDGRIDNEGGNARHRQSTFLQSTGLAVLGRQGRPADVGVRQWPDARGSRCRLRGTGALRHPSRCHGRTHPDGRRVGAARGALRYPAVCRS